MAWNGIDVNAHIVPFVRDPRPLQAALAPERQRRITPGDWRHGYVATTATGAGTVRLEGLTPLLERVCWNHAARRAPPRKYHAHSSGSNNTSVIHHVKGAPRGTLVHKQVKDLVTLNAAAFQRRNVQGAHPWAHRIVDELLKRNWIPAAADLPVYDEAWGLATELGTRHLLCVHIPTGDLICVEIKTGYSGGAWLHSDGLRMRGYLHAYLPDAPYHRALVQSLVGMLLLVRGHQVPGRVGCAVVRIDERCLELSLLSADFAQQHSAALMTELAGHALQAATPAQKATKAKKRRRND